MPLSHSFPLSLFLYLTTESTEDSIPTEKSSDSPNHKLWDVPNHGSYGQHNQWGSSRYDHDGRSWWKESKVGKWWKEEKKEKKWGDKKEGKWRKGKKKDEKWWGDSHWLTHCKSAISPVEPLGWPCIDSIVTSNDCIFYVTTVRVFCVIDYWLFNLFIQSFHSFIDLWNAELAATAIRSFTNNDVALNRLHSSAKVGMIREELLKNRHTSLGPSYPSYFKSWHLRRLTTMICHIYIDSRPVESIIYLTHVLRRLVQG